MKNFILRIPSFESWVIGSGLFAFLYKSVLAGLRTENVGLPAFLVGDPFPLRKIDTAHRVFNHYIINFGMVGTVPPYRLNIASDP
jgi:hypothetical protein